MPIWARRLERGFVFPPCPLVCGVVRVISVVSVLFSCRLSGDVLGALEEADMPLRLPKGKETMLLLGNWKHGMAGAVEVAYALDGDEEGEGCVGNALAVALWMVMVAVAVAVPVVECCREARGV